MRRRVPLAVVLACLAFLASPATIRTASAQDADGGAPAGGPGGGSGGGGDSKAKLDRVLSVLRNHQSDAGKTCLQAMTEVHQTEDQVASLGQQDSSSTHPDNGADIARDVLDSDYETAEVACQPDAERVCRANPADPNCAKLDGPGPR